MTEGSDDARFQLGDSERRPLQEMIEDKLRELIDRGDLKPGDRLPNEAELAAQMKVARGSLRSALQRLEVLRLVEVKRGRGWYVRHNARSEGNPLQEWLSEARPDISQLFELRLALETFAAGLAAVRASDEDLLEIALLSEGHRHAAPDVNELVRTDEAFHDAILRTSANGLLAAVYRMLVPELAEWRAKIFSDDDTAPADSANDHDTILFFLQERDPRGARVAMTNHLLKLHNKITDGSAELKDFV